MKNIQAHKSAVCHPIQSRLNWTNLPFTILGVAVFVSCLLSGKVAWAQTPAIKLTFEDAPGTTTTNVGSAGTGIVLNIFDAANAAADLHGAAGSGVSGQLDGN